MQVNRREFGASCFVGYRVTLRFASKAGGFRGLGRAPATPPDPGRQSACPVPQWSHSKSAGHGQLAVILYHFPLGVPFVCENGGVGVPARCFPWRICPRQGPVIWSLSTRDGKPARVARSLNMDLFGDRLPEVGARAGKCAGKGAVDRVQPARLELQSGVPGPGSRIF